MNRIYKGYILIPVLALEKPLKLNAEFLKPTYWVFLGVLVLIYLKLFWKLISSKYKTKSKGNRTIKKYKKIGG
ncbi:MAG: hypothetical protein PWP71_2369 [Clostridia bacterium]|jgi:hypothetical protein|nr:hypothetical protein [Clostridia bacterium]